MASPTTSVLIVDDDDDMRFLVRVLLEHVPDVEIVAEAADAEVAIERWRDTGPDVVVVDYLMPGRNGLELARAMLTEAPGQQIILFTANLDPATMLAADAVGVCEVLDKDRVKELPERIRGCGERASRPPGD